MTGEFSFVFPGKKQCRNGKRNTLLFIPFTDIIPVIHETSCFVILILILLSGCAASVGAGDTGKSVDPYTVSGVLPVYRSDNCRESVGTTICNPDSESLNAPIMQNEDTGIVIIDIRTPEEDVIYHIPGVGNYDYTDPFFLRTWHNETGRDLFSDTAEPV